MGRARPGCGRARWQAARIRAGGSERYSFELLLEPLRDKSLLGNYIISYYIILNYII